MNTLFLDFLGSDPSKMDQTRKFREQTSQILEFKPEGLDFQYSIKVKPNMDFGKILRFTKN